MSDAPDEIIFNDRRVISHMTAREKEIYRYGYLAAGIKIAADIESKRPATRRTDRDVEASKRALAQRAYYDAMTDAARIARGESNG